MRQLPGGHLDEAAIELRVQVPVAGAAAAAQLATAPGTLEARFELRRVKPVDELDKRRVPRDRCGMFVRFRALRGLAYPLHGVDLAVFVLCEKAQQQLLD